MAKYQGGSGRDLYTGGDDADQIYGFGGDDKLNGGRGGDIISGGEGADRVEGSDGDDTLYSGDQSPPFNLPYYNNPFTLPVVDSGVEQDVLVGGSGSDTFFAGYGDTVDGKTDDGSSYGDYLYISFMGATSGVTADFRKETQTIGGGKISGVENISYVQGSDFNDNLNVASYVGNGYSDFTVVLGMGGDDTLTAGYYTGTLLGGEGNDVIDGRGSEYLMYVDGEAGDDILYANDDFVTVAGGAGVDMITAHGETHGGAGDDQITMLFSYYGGLVTGDGGDDEIHAASSGNEISGDDGADVLVGAEGADTLVSGSFGDDPAGPSADAGIEQDQLDGGAGDDTLYAGYGDIVDGGAGKDTLSLSLLGAAKGVRLDTGAIIGDDTAQVFGGSISGIETLRQLTGSTFADRFTLSSTTNVTVHGAAGNDVFVTGVISATIFGDEGNDTLVSGAASDRFDGGTGVDTVDYSQTRSALSFALGDGLSPGGTGDTLIGVENVIGTSRADELVGNSADNRFIGAAGADRLSGAGGDDVLDGGAGRDVLAGGDGNDDLFGGTDRDTLTGGAGKDVFHFAEEGVARTSAEADLVTDFSQVDRDRLDLSKIDGVTGLGRVDPFTFIGIADFSGQAGELRYQSAGKHTIVSADTDGDRVGDVFIKLDGHVTLTAKDFVFASDPVATPTARAHDLLVLDTHPLTQWTDLHVALV